MPFSAIQRLVDRVVTVSEESMSQALLMLVERAKQVVEPAGAASVAALLQYPRGKDKQVGLVRHWPNHADHLHVRFKSNR